MECEDFPPEFQLTESEFYPTENFLFMNDIKENPPRKKSLDLEFSILGFIDRKIREKYRTRVMSDVISDRHP